jgi:hypothetical protein
MTIIVPSNLDISCLIPSHYRSDKKLNMSDGMYYIISLCIPDILDKHKHEQLQDEGFTYLCGSLLCKIVGTQYTSALALLVDNNILVRNNYYLNGKQCRGYRLNTLWLSQTTEHVLKAPGIKKRLQKHYKNNDTQQAKRLRDIEHVTQWLKPKYLKIDIEAAHNYIEFYRAGLISELNKSAFKTKEQFNEARQRIFYRTEHQKLVTRAIANADFKLFRDDAGRLYSPLTAIKKELRNFIIVEGEQLCSVDISASQPYLFQILFSLSFWETTDPLSLYNLNRKLYNDLKKHGVIKQVVAFLSSTKTRAFINISWEKDFYTLLADQVKSQATKAHAEFETRSKTKQTVMYLLYDTYVNKQPAYYKVFKSLYKDEVKLMDLIKQAGKSVLPIILQAIEAELVLNRIGKELSSLLSNSPFYTVHDSIYTQKENVLVLQDAMQEILGDIVGAMPGLKIEELKHQSAFDNLQNAVQEDWNKIYKNVTSTSRMLWMPSQLSFMKEVPLLYQLPSLNKRTFYSTRYINTGSHAKEK